MSYQFRFVFFIGAWAAGQWKSVLALIILVCRVSAWQRSATALSRSSMVSKVDERHVDEGP
jgi:hypothetical protein